MIELSEFQYKTLNDAANGDSKAFIVLHPSPSDSPEKKASHEKDVQAASQLVIIGLAEDVSAKFKDSIEMSKINSNREFQVLIITDIGLKMFTDCDKRLVN